MLRMRTKREEGRKEGANKDSESGAALTKWHDNCQTLSKIKSKGICIKCHKQNTVHGNTKTLQKTHVCFY